MYLLLLSILLLILLISIRSRQKVRKNEQPPGPPGLPFIGNLHQYDKSRAHKYLWQISKKYGPLAQLKHGSKPILVVSSARMAEEILRTHDLVFCSRPSILGQQKLSYNGLDIAFSSYNECWKEMRKICVLHLFSNKQVLSFQPIREAEVSHMINKISQISASSQVVNLSEISMSFASNLICKVAFDKRYDDEEYEKKRFDRRLIEAQALMTEFYFSDIFPSLHWLDKISGKLSRLENNFKELDFFYQELIDEHTNPSRSRSEKPDILDLMLQFKDQKSSPLHLTWDHIKALLMNIFVAGTDTVASSLVWTMTALMMRPDIMRKAQAEIRGLFPNKHMITEDDVKKLKYMKAILLEGLRLYPPAPLLYRRLAPHESCTIDGYKIKPGTKVIINGWAIARDPETWRNPEAFLPERFMESKTIDNLKVHEFDMIPFGGGRRGCPGMTMGLTAVELALANLLFSFDWDLPNGMRIEDIDTEALPGLTMHKKNPLLVVAKRYVS